MSDQSSSPSAQSPEIGPTGEQPAAGSSPPVQSPPGGQESGLQERLVAITEEKPEVAVGAAFASGFLFAMILRRLAS